MNTNTALRKAAILVAALDTRSADALLQRMGAERAARVRSAVMQLGQVSRSEEQAVLDEFMQAGDPPSPSDDSGIELDDSLVQKLSSPQPAYAPPAPADPPESDAAPFRFLHEATADSLAKHLRGEHPQLIAFVVAHLPPKYAADLLKRIPPPLQVNVLRRVAELDKADPQVLQDVERELELLLSDELRAARNRSAGLAAVSTILNAAGADRGELLANVTRHDQSLAVQLGEKARETLAAKVNATAAVESQREPASTHPLQPTTPSNAANGTVSGGGDVETLPGTTEDLPTIAFESLARLEESALATLFRETDPHMTLLALVGADRDFLDRILKQLAPREARSLERKIRTVGPLRLADIERAQQQVAHRAAELAAAGRLRLPEPKRFAVAA